MKRYFILILFIAPLCRAQVITVIDKVSREPVPGVLIYSADKKTTASTNARGQADLTSFSASDSIYLAMIGYRPEGLTVQGVRQGTKVELTSAELSLGEVVVATNRWEEQASENPNRINTIRKKDIELQNPQTAADLLESGGYVYMQKSQLAGGSPILRGFATNRVMLVVDGVRMNNAIFRSGNVQNVIALDANAIESAEVLFGPGAVMYGSDAIGGVMDFHTLRPQFSDSAGKTQTRVNVMGRYSSANNERTFHTDLTVGGKHWSWLGSFSRSDYHDLRAGTNGNAHFLRPTYTIVRDQGDTMVTNPDPSLQVGTGFSQTNVMQKFAVKLTPRLEADYSFHYSESSNAPRYDRLYDTTRNGFGKLDFAEWYYGPQTWMMNRVSVSHSGSNGMYDRARVIGAWQKFGESRHDRRFGRLTRTDQTEQVDAYSLNIDLDKKINSRLSVFYGAEAVFNKIGSETFETNIHTKFRTPAQTRYPNHSTWQAHGVYTNLKYNVSPKLVMTLGARYSYYRIMADFDTTFNPFPVVHAVNNNDALNGAIGFVYLPNATSRVYLNAATGFRAPNIDDIGKVFESEPGSVVIPNTNLRPEYAYNAEAGFVKVFGRYVKADAAVYYTLLRNALARRAFLLNGRDSIIYQGDLSAVQAIQNLTQANVYGVQAGIEAELPAGLGLSVKASYQKGEEQSEDSLLYYPKSHVPPAYGRVDLFYKRRNLRIDFYVVHNAEMPFNDLSIGDRNDHVPFAKDARGLPYVPAWTTVNIKVAVYLTKRFSLTGGVENITDELYRPFSSGISAPGRNFIVSVRIKV